MIRKIPEEDSLWRWMMDECERLDIIMKEVNTRDKMVQDDNRGIRMEATKMGRLGWSWVV